MNQSEIDAEQALMQEQRALTPRDLVDPRVPRASRSLRRQRMDICKACDRLHFGMCGVCGCLVKAKTTLEPATCPIGKW